MAEHTPANGHRRVPPPPQRPSRPMPHDLEAEASLLGGVILRPHELLPELHDVEIEDFYLNQHKVVWAAIRQLEHASLPIDVVMIEHEIQKLGHLDSIGGIAFLGELALKCPTASNVIAYRDIVLMLAKNRRAILELSSALERAYTWQHDPGELVGEICGQLARLEQDRPATADDARAKWCVSIESYLGDEEPDDDDAVDWIIRDLIPRAEPAIWGGPMKGGKTWSAMDLCLAIALGKDWVGFENTLKEPARVLALFLEDNKRRITKRLSELARARGLHFLSDPTVLANLRVNRAPIQLPNRADQRAFAREIKRWGAKVVIVDNLTRVMMGDPNSTRDAAIFTRVWTELGEETGASIVFLHHTKKPMGDQREADPFDALKGSSDFGAAARNMIVINPLRLDGELMAEVRMRGNIDLTRETFVLGFERWKSEEWGQRWCAQLKDRGDAEQLKEAAKKQRREKKANEKKADRAAEYTKRRDKVLEIVNQRGSVTLGAAAISFGLSPNSMKPVFQALVADRILKEAGKRGYVLADENPQEGLAL